MEGTEKFGGKVKAMKNGTRGVRGAGKKRVYDFILEYIIENRYAPSVKEICDGTGFRSTSSVYMNLLKLENEGKIEMKRNTPRAIRLTGYEYRKAEEQA